MKLCTAHGIIDFGFHKFNQFVYNECNQNNIAYILQKSAISDNYYQLSLDC